MEINLFGLELLENTVENQIKHNYEKSVVLFHWCLISNGFKCIGKGDSKEISGDEIQSELLPPEWNTNNDILLRYINNTKLYLARVVLMSDDLIFNLIRANDMKITCCTITTNCLLDEVVQKRELAGHFISELVEPQTPSLLTTKPPQLALPNNLHPSMIKGKKRLGPSSFFGDVGRSDLDPLGGLAGNGGGMLFPSGSRGYPRIRYDPPNPMPSHPIRWPGLFGGEIDHDFLRFDDHF